LVRTQLTAINPDVDKQTFAIDLSQSWTPSTVSVVVNDRPAAYIGARSPVLWYDSVSNTVYSYGGWPYATSPVKVWGFKPGTDGSLDWSVKYLQGDGSSFSDLTRASTGLTAVSDKAFYYMGGYGTRETDPRFSNLPANYRFAMTGLTTFDFGDSTWKNSSTGGQYRLGGRGQFVPLFGEEGVLLFFGGDQPTVQKFAMGSGLVSMSTITVYDIKSKSFYQQTATGDIPLPRNYFCSVGVGAADTASWEM
jgi:hypothetical protein